MLDRRLSIWLTAAVCALALGAACAVTDDDGSGDSKSTSSGAGTGGAGGSANGGGGSTSNGSHGGGGGSFNPQGSGGSGGIFVDPCDPACSDTELCDPVAVALDDNCNGVVNEGCSCSVGAVQACFKGNPAHLNDAGCFPGTQQCNELGSWGPCEGGVHATDMCYQQGADCHPISTSPFVPINLKTGTGNFSSDATSETFTVTCPSNVSPCPTPNNTSYTPLQSGEYTVTYNKTTANGSDQCSYPLFVGAPGLRVELSWEWIANQGNDTVDVDLHLHKPQDFSPWGGDGGTAEDCAFDNCTASDFLFPIGPSPNWFTGVAPPAPVNWYLDPVMEKNTCYYGPKGNGADWQNIGMGCHNPRLDIDNISCDPTITDPQNSSFCNPENINIDYPPKDQWTRVGVHYYSAHSQTYNVSPVVKIFCHGKLAAELGPNGYYNPTAPVVFTPADSDTRFWLVADVLFRDDECSDELCVVEPLYLDPTARTPVLTTVNIVQQTYGPPYPPIPQ